MKLGFDVAEDSPATIVLNNGRMGGYGRNMPAATEKFVSNLLGGNYAALAEALGLSGERVETLPRSCQPPSEPSRQISKGSLLL